MALLATAQILESNEGRGISVKAGQATATREFMLIDFQGEDEIIFDGFGQNPFTNPDSSTIITPKIGDPHPLFSNLIAVDFQISKVPGSINHWRASWNYQNNRFRESNTGANLSQGPEGIGFQEFSANVISKPYMAYRANPVRPETVEFGADIGGEPVDAGCAPVTMFRQQYEIQFSQTLKAQAVKNIRTYGFAAGRRGSFPDFPAGSVLYLGAAIQRVGIESYRVQHKYLHDEFSHAIQAPVYNAHGQCDLNDDGKVDTVRWVQPFELSFSALPGLGLI